MALVLLFVAISALTLIVFVLMLRPKGGAPAQPPNDEDV
jgi:preprotein translocase subunit SecG